MEFRIDLFTRREKRAAIVMLVATLVVAAAVAGYLRPAHAPSARAAAATFTPKPLRPEILALAAESATTVYIVAGDRNAMQAGSRRVFRSTDAGRTWRALTLPDGAAAPASVSAGVTSAEVVVLTYGGSSGAYSAPRGWRSYDRGDHWTRLAQPEGPPATWPRFIDARHGSYATFHDADVIAWRTDDGGLSWREVATVRRGGEFSGAPVPPGGSVSFSISSPTMAWLAINDTMPSPSGRVVHGARLLRSTDGGATWLQVDLSGAGPAPRPEGAAVQLPEVDARGHGFLVVQNFPGGALLTTTRDGGETWSPMRPTSAPWIDIGDDGTWWSADGAQVSQSTDLGATWDTFVARVPPGTSLGTVRGITRAVAWSTYRLFSGGRPDEPSVLRSLDGGHTWTAIRGPARLP